MLLSSWPSIVLPPTFSITSKSDTIKCSGGGNANRSGSLIFGTTVAEGQTSRLESEQAPLESVARRRLILLRHAKSSWENPSLRGQADAVDISHKLQELGWIPELILSSDAVRTKETLKIMQEQVRGFLEAEVHFISSFYSIAAMDGQTAEHLQHTICRFSRDEIHTVMCMGHNRGWEEAASMLSGTSIELKTCHAALLEATGRSWEETFLLAGFGGWKVLGIAKPNSSVQ
ncbi:uncharacterized protein At3g52155, chloroplastic isoform X2 [Diospyros lotus]|uniref:uncharacterized protein At3g52155, chloroplastic isoform X2 n=1 Tax=Diospyros lotus TaxID=55363 RepID=UPI002259B241|nr:uncharacterized protein At3g52155, chloroplastic isoform X2 [Diospyros lotus]